MPVHRSEMNIVRFPSFHTLKPRKGYHYQIRIIPLIISPTPSHVCGHGDDSRLFVLVQYSPALPYNQHPIARYYNDPINSASRPAKVHEPGDSRSVGVCAHYGRPYTKYMTTELELALHFRKSAPAPSRIETLSC